MYSYKTIVFVGPSAVGKTHAANLLLQSHSDLFKQALAHTTRKPRRTSETDRLFCSEEEFEELKSKNHFLVSGKFGDSSYGYTHKSITDEKKHVLMNAWPALVPQLAQLDNVIFVGLLVSNSSLQMLKERMASRGDSPKIINDRIHLIQKDIQDMNKFSMLINEKGKLFLIEDNNTLPDKIIPWLLNKLEL